MRRSFAFVLAVALPLSAPMAALARPIAGEIAAEPAPAVRFARAVSAEANDGYRIATFDAMSDGNSYRLDLTMARDKVARRHTLEFDRRGDRVVDYRAARVSAPYERRTYRFAAELVSLIRSGGITSIQSECGSYVVQGPKGSASVDPFDYHTVHGRSRGRAAAGLVARAMAERLESGMQLAAILPSDDVPASAVRAIDIVLVKGGEDVIHVGTDRTGRVVFAELRYSPAAYDAWGARFPDARRLRQKLRATRAVISLQLEERGDDEPRLSMGLRGGEVYVIDARDFETDDEELAHACGC